MATWGVAAKFQLQQAAAAQDVLIGSSAILFPKPCKIRNRSTIAIPSSGRPRLLPPVRSMSLIGQSIRTAFDKLFNADSDSESDSDELVKVEGTVLLERRQLVDFSFPGASGTDAFSELLGKQVSLRLVSQDIDPVTGSGKVSEEAFLEDWLQKDKPILADGGTEYSVSFALPRDFGIPAALLVENNHPNDFRLIKLLLHLPNNESIVFSCNSWIFNRSRYDGPRIFFTNQPCLPNDTPAGVKTLRIKDLDELRGDGSGTRKRQDRIYDYDVYNDLGDPDSDKELSRPILGGSKEFPYPRRCRTGRNNTLTDRTAESPVASIELIYVPRDELFSNVKWADFLADTLKSISNNIIPTIENLFDTTDHFDSMEEIFDLYQKGLNMREFTEAAETDTEKQYGLEFLNETFDQSTNDPARLKFPLPQVLQDNKQAWEEDEEFARQTLAGLNPIVIERLKEFPPMSKLDPKVFGPPTSAITTQHIEHNLEGLTVDEAMNQKRLFMVDYHDTYLPYLERINALDGKAYASRSIFFLTREGTLNLVAIELSLPPPNKGEKSKSRVFTPPSADAPELDVWIWRLAKTHASINDAGYHQLISHWLRSHATMEPFIIATNRELSTLHPLYVLLKPHLKNTLNINALARKALINVEGVIERTFTPGKYSMEMSSAVYKSWRFDEQALPADLIKRGMAEEDSNSPHGLKLLVKDYPFAVDGLDIWFAVESWVHDYLSIYYVDDRAVVEDTELQNWWTEIREVGHGDKRDENWWPIMNSLEALQQVLSTIIWIASAHHAAVNFGQYSYAGFMPNKPTKGRLLIPEDGSPDMKDLEKDPNTFYLKSISTQVQSVTVMSVIKILSTHSSDEEYLGQHSDNSWTNDERALKAFEKFQDRISQAEKDMKKRNFDPTLKNRYGSIKVPYSLLFPTSSKGLTGRGIPNSTSI